MQSIDSPKFKGQALLAAWKSAPQALGLPMEDWGHCDIRGQRCVDFRAVYRNLSYFAAPDCDLKHSVFAHSNLTHADFQRSKLNKSIFVSAHLEQARLNAIDGRSTNFSHAHLRSASFQRATLQHAHFRFANLHHANFQQGDLRWSDFRGANLAQAKMDGSSLVGVQINPQTVEASGWREEDVADWIAQGARWSDEAIEGTRWSSGVDLQSKQHTRVNVENALRSVCTDLGHILIAGQPPTLFIAGVDVHSTQLTERLQQIATYTVGPNSQPKDKWEPMHQWLRTGGVLHEWAELDGEIVCVASIEF